MEIMDGGIAMPTLAGRYRLLGEVATTAEGVLHAAESLIHNRPVALLVLHADLAADPDFVAAVRETSARLGKIACPHPTLATTYEYGTTESGEIFVAVEAVGRRSLRESLLEQGAYDPVTALRLAIQVGEALEVLHRVGVVHGELRPETVFLVKNADGVETVKVTDAHITAARRTAAGARLRDKSLKAYLAPEQITERETSEAADVHALGLLLSELITGERVRGAATSRAREIPSSIQRIIGKALDRRPAKRYSDVSLMLNEMWTVEAQLQRTGADSPSLRAVPRRILRPVRGALRRYAIVAAAVIVVGVAVWVVGAGHMPMTASSPLATAPATTLPPRSALPSKVSEPQAASPPVTGASVSSGRSPLPAAAHEDAATAPTAAAAPPASATAPPAAMRPASSANSAAHRETPPASRDVVGLDRAEQNRATMARPVARAAALPRRQPESPERGRPGDGDGSAIIDWLLKEGR
jgi:serine/threonine-protein kinase